MSAVLRRWEVCCPCFTDGLTPNAGDYVEVVTASDYDALTAKLDDANAYAAKVEKDYAEVKVKVAEMENALRSIVAVEYESDEYPVTLAQCDMRDIATSALAGGGDSK